MNQPALPPGRGERRTRLYDEQYELVFYTLQRYADAVGARITIEDNT